MGKTLVVTEPFGEYARGALITDEAVVAAILESENASSVAVRAPLAEPAQPVAGA